MAQQEPAKEQKVKSATRPSREPFAEDFGIHRTAPLTASITAPTPPPNLSQATIRRTFANPRTLSPNDILHLQRTAGNQAVQRLLIGAQSATSATQPQLSAPLQRASATTIQRKMSFTTDALSQKKSKKAKFSDALSKGGISRKKTDFEAIRTLLDKYSNTHSTIEEVTLMVNMEELANSWIKNHGSTASDDGGKKATLQTLLKAIEAELPKAKKQRQYMDDLTEENRRHMQPKLAPKKGGAFQYLSGLGKSESVDHAHALAAGKSNEDVAGMTQATLDLVKKYKLTDAEIAAIKIYTVDDYKYINPAQQDKDTFFTPEMRESRLKQVIPDIKQLYSERGGAGVAISYGNNMVSAVVERGTLQEGYVLTVYRNVEGGGSKPILVGRGNAVSVIGDQAQGPGTKKDEVFGPNSRVNIKLDANLPIQNNDNLVFVDASSAGVQQAKKEGMLHGEIAKQGMAKLPDMQPGVVYRGMTLTPDVLKNSYAPQKIIQYGGFTSTAKERDASLEFIRQELAKDKVQRGTKVGVLLWLDVKEKAKDLSDFSHVASEKEILLMPGTMFKVEKNPLKPSTAEVSGERISFYIVMAKQITEKEQKTDTPQRPTKKVGESNSGESSEEKGAPRNWTPQKALSPATPSSNRASPRAPGWMKAKQITELEELK